MLGVATFLHITHIKTWQSGVIINIAFVMIFNFKESAHRTASSAVAFNVIMGLALIISESDNLIPRQAEYYRVFGRNPMQKIGG